MAITAKFVADFSPFTDAVNKAEVELRSFEQNASKVGKSLNSMVDNFSGRKLIQDATLMAEAVERIGGPTKLTQNELQRLGARAQEAAEKMHKLGVDVPPGIQKIAAAAQDAEKPTLAMSTAFSALKGIVTGFLAVNVVSWFTDNVKAGIAYGDMLVNLHAKTDLTYRDLQILEDLGISAGVSVESLANAVQLLQQRIGDGSARKGIHDLGLSFDEIRRQTPGDQFASIGEAIARIEDPTIRAKVAAEVFGRAWKEILPALRENMAETARSVNQLSDAHIEAADLAGDRWQKFWNDQKKGWAAWVGGILVAKDDVVRAWDQMQIDMAKKFVLPGVKSAGPAIPNGASINDVFDPTMISRLVVAGKTLDELSASIKRNEVAADAAKKAHDTFQKSVTDNAYAVRAMALPALGDLTKTFIEFGEVSDGIINNSGKNLGLLWEGQFRGVDLFGNALQGNVIPALGTFAERVEVADTSTTTWRDDIDVLSQSFANLGAIGDNALGNLTRGIGIVTNAFSVGLNGMDSFKKGLSALGSGGILSGLAGITSGIGGIVGAAQAAYGAVKALINVFRGGEEGIYVNPERDQWFAEHGGTVQGVGDRVMAAGIDGETARQMIERVFQSDTRSEFADATAAFRNAGVPGFLTGTGGKYLNFGSGTPAMLHGRERVMTEAEGRSDASQWGSMTKQLESIERLLATNQRKMGHMLQTAMRDAIVQAG